MPDILTLLRTTPGEQPLYLYQTPYGNLETILLADWEIHRVQRQAGKWLIRRAPNGDHSQPDHWHGPFDSEEIAIKKFLDCHAPIELTEKDLSYYKKHEYWGLLDDGRESIVALDKWTGATVLTTNFRVVRKKQNA